MQNKRTLRKTNKKTHKNQQGGAADPPRRWSRASGSMSGSRSSGSKKHYDKLRSTRISTGSSSTRTSGSETHYSHLQRPSETDSMRTIINSAGLLKATGLKVFTETGRSRTSYNPEAIKKILRTKGHTNETIIQSIAEKVSKQGIGATARELGVEGYNKNLAKENATQISLMHIPEQTSSSKKQTSLNQFVENRFPANTPLTHINVSGQEQITYPEPRKLAATKRSFGSANTYNPANNMALLERSRTNNSIDQQSLLNARARILKHSPERPTTANNAEKVRKFLLFKSKHTQSGELNNSNQELFADAIAVERKNKALLKKMEKNLVV